MKSYFFSYMLAASALLFVACNDNSQSPEKSTETTAGDTTGNSTLADDAGLTRESPSFTSVDSRTSASINEIVSHYLHIKNALADDNDAEAANGAGAMVKVIEKVDHAALKGEQMKLYMEVEETLKEHAEHTAANAGKIDHQREHFVMMSDDIYDLVKAFGTDQPLYVDHCPMANDNKGANWLSEKKEISNPYMGKKMPTCGTVQKLVKK